MIKLAEIVKTYITQSGEVRALDHINLELNEKALYMILGKSGCGKTTLLNIMSGIDSYTEGKLYVNDADIGSFKSSEMDDYRNLNIGIVFQEFNLISELTVSDNLRLVIEMQSADKAGRDKNEIDKCIQETLSRVGLEGYENRKINELSGGERQRIAIARAIIKKPEIIFADEPTGNLDSSNSKMIFELLKSFSGEYTVIVVTHDRESAYKYADTVIEIENGKIISRDEISGNSGQDKAEYSLKAVSDEDGEQLDKLSQSELISTVIRILNTSGKSCEMSIRKVLCDKTKETTENKRNEDTQRKKVESVPLPWKYRFKLALCFLKQKKLTLFFTVLITTISIVLVYACSLAAFYQEKQITSEYLNEYKPRNLPLYTEVQYIDPFFEKLDKRIKSGKYIDSLIDEKVIENAVVFSVLRGQDVSKSDETEPKIVNNMSVSVLFVPADYTGFEIKTGKSCLGDGEMLLTDYAAAILRAEPGDKICYNTEQFTVSGIIKTDYIEYNWQKKLFSGDGIYAEYNTDFKYNTVYLSENYLNKEMKISDNMLFIDCSDFSLSNRERSYLKSNRSYRSAESLTPEDLAYGRLPQNVSEIVVSQNYAKLVFPDIEEKGFSEACFSFKNIYDSRYNNYYSDKLNMYDYYPQGVTVVGVASADYFTYSNADIFINNTVWQTIKDDYFSFYYTERVLRFDGESYDKQISLLYDRELGIDEPGVEQINVFAVAIDEMQIFLYALLALTVSLNIFMMITFIQLSIKGNRKNIGILRSLGVSAKTTGMMFMLEIQIIYIASVLMSIPVISAMLRIANNSYSGADKNMPFDIICWNLGIFIIVLALEAIFDFLFTNIPIQRIGKKKPVDLIR